MTWKNWGKAVLAAVISGVSSSVLSWAGLNVIKPDMMKGMDFMSTLQTMGIIALFAGILSGLRYLQQSPLPNGQSTVERTPPAVVIPGVHAGPSAPTQRDYVREWMDAQGK